MMVVCSATRNGGSNGAEDAFESCAEQLMGIRDEEGNPLQQEEVMVSAHAGSPPDCMACGKT
jgi:hypothetical protein